MKILGGIIEPEVKDIGDLITIVKKLFVRKSHFDKTNVFILFIDDEEFPVVDNLKKSGWAVDKVKDVTNIDDNLVQRAHIIFIDNKGVGKVLSENEEGIGLAKLIKKSYGKKKRVILYSAHTVALGGHFNIIDNQLPKDSNTYEFELMIKSELEKLS